MYKNLSYTSTKDMSRDEWLAERRKSIGGSDAASLLGLNEYTSPYSLFCEKTGKIAPDDISDKEAVRLGNDLEQYAAERWMESTGEKVRRCNFIIRNPDFPFAHANVDRLVIGKDEGLELKTTSSWDIAQQCRQGRFPDRYYAQCCHYLLVTGAERWHLGILCFGAGFFHFTIERNEAEIDALAAAERDFWGCVTNNTPPALDGTAATTEAIKTIYRDSTPGTVADLTAVGHHIEAYNALRKQISELEEMQAEHENAIKDFMGGTEKGIYSDTTISWKSSTRSTFDKSRYEAVNGKISKEFYNVTETRTFRVNQKKKGA